MKKIAVLNDLSGIGRCSLTAAIPVISAMGVQACPMPTAVLSNQTGYASYYFEDYTDRMDVWMQEWKKLSFCPDGIYTGFLAGEGQADKILRFLELFRKETALVLVDPIMGDNGGAFSFLTETFLCKIKSLCDRADVLTPNLTEALLLLYGQKDTENQWRNLQGLPRKERLCELERLGRKLCEEFSLKALVITGIEDTTEEGKVRIGNFVLEQGDGHWIWAPKTGGSYSGTGDLFVAVLCAAMVKGKTARSAAELAARFLSRAIQDAVSAGTDRNEGVCFEPYLHLLWESPC